MAEGRWWFAVVSQICGVALTCKLIVPFVTPGTSSSSARDARPPRDAPRGPGRDRQGPHRNVSGSEPRGGRGRRGGGGGGGGKGEKRAPKSANDLDAELDAFMKAPAPATKQMAESIHAPKPGPVSVGARQGGGSASRGHSLRRRQAYLPLVLSPLLRRAGWRYRDEMIRIHLIAPQLFIRPTNYVHIPRLLLFVPCPSKPFLTILAILTSVQLAILDLTQRHEARCPDLAGSYLPRWSEGRQSASFGFGMETAGNWELETQREEESKDEGRNVRLVLVHLTQP